MYSSLDSSPLQGIMHKPVQINIHLGVIKGGRIKLSKETRKSIVIFHRDNISTGSSSTF